MLQTKATVTLAAGDLLWERGFPGDAASRYYYAMYQAAMSRFAGLGVTPATLQSGAVRWEHATIANTTFRLRNRRDDRGLYTAVMRLRVCADYELEGVKLSELEGLRPAIRDFVRELTT